MAERASRLGQRIDYRVKLRNLNDLAQHVTAGVGISVLSEAVARKLRPVPTVLRLAEAWALRRLYVCAIDFRQLSPYAVGFARQLIERDV